MKNLTINPTKNTPYVSFKSDGELSIGGRSYPRDAVKFYEPIFAWADEFRSDNIVINIKLEYFNTSTNKLLLSLFKLIVTANEKSEIQVNWHYEEGDLDIMEIGQHFHKILKVPFRFIEFAVSNSSCNF